MTTLTQITAATGQDVPINQNFQALSPAALYARRYGSGISGLVLGLYGGYFGGNPIADLTATLTASEATLHVVAARSDGAVTVSTGTTNWNNSTDYFRIGIATTGVATITGWQDFREAYAAPVGGGGGGGAVSSVNGQTGAVVLEAADIDYDNAISGLTATDVQAAIDEVAAGMGGGAVASVNGQTGAVVLELGDLDDVNAAAPSDGDVLAWDNTAGEWVPAAPSGGAADFTDLGDVPASYAGASLQAVRVNVGETALEFYTPSGGGSSGGINPQTGTSYTLVLGDAGYTVTMANAAANVLTVPPNSSIAFPVGTQIGVMMNGAGQTSVAAGVGVTVNTIETLLLLRQGAVAVLEQTAADVWRLTGELRPLVPIYRSRQRFDPANGTTVGTVQGVSFTSAGTVSHQALSTSSVQSTMRRTRWATTAAAGNAAGIYEAAVTKVRGNATGIGGFTAEFVFTQATNINGHQCFVGLAASTATLGGEPSALTNMIGMGYDSTDGSGGNWQFMRNDSSGSAVKIDLSTPAARGTTHVYSMSLRAPQNGSDVFVRIVNLSTGDVVLDTSYNTDLPANTTFLGLRAQIRTGATTTIGLLEVMSIYAGYQE